jgi:hypothetical protein
MVRFLKGFFKNELKEPQTENKYLLDIPDENSVSLVLDNNNKPIIKLNIQKTDDTSCQKTAEFLFLMNKGVYQAQIIEMLKEIAATEESKSIAVESILTYWLTYLESYNKDIVNAPCVSPLTFSKLVTKREIHEHE